MDVKSQIESGQTALGIELGSTRIKAVLVDSSNKPVASGGHGWENSQIDGIWTYPLDEVWEGLRSCYADLKKEVKEKYGVTLKSFKAMGFSGMMHGYITLDRNGKQLAPFRTWRNNITGESSRYLTELLGYNIPQRWSIAHLHYSILKDEDYINEIDYLTTLAGYVHWKLTDTRIMGVGEASGMFPIDLSTGSFNEGMMDKFDEAVKQKNYPWKLKEILPEVRTAGDEAGKLTAAGAALLDPEGDLEGGITFCPPEGDAETGMVATNTIAVRTGNVSAGTSVFAMIVLEKELKKVHESIDLVTTPDGHLVAMAHSNNCSSDYDAWIALFGEAAKALGADVSTPVLYDTLLGEALKGDPDCGGLLSYGYISGEHGTGFSEGRPLFARSQGSRFTLANFMRSHLFTALCAMRTGINILTEEEGVKIDEIKGHGGFFKTAEVGQRIMAAATGFPCSILETAGEGGAWGIALLAAYTAEEDKTGLPAFMDKVFADSMGEAVKPTAEDLKGFETFFERYHKGLGIERAAIEALD